MTEAIKTATALLSTDKGDIKIELDLERAPITAGNFKDLVERGFYNGLCFPQVNLWVYDSRWLP